MPEGHDAAIARPVFQPLSTDALQRRLETHTRDYPRDAAGQLDLQMLQFVQERPVPDFAALSSLASEDRDMIAAGDVTVEIDAEPCRLAERLNSALLHQFAPQRVGKCFTDLDAAAYSRRIRPSGR